MLNSSLWWIWGLSFSNPEPATVIADNNLLLLCCLKTKTKIRKKKRSLFCTSGKKQNSVGFIIENRKCRLFCKKYGIFHLSISDSTHLNFPIQIVLIKDRGLKKKELGDFFAFFKKTILYSAKANMYNFNTVKKEENSSYPLLASQNRLPMFTVS